jgi:uncharacterized membrane protein
MTDRRLGIAITVLGFLGLGIATYLTYVHYAGLEPICAASRGCEIVQQSKYAEFAGIPVPVLGLVGYIGILLSLLIPGDIGRAATALLALFGFGFSAYLTYLEIYKIKAICQWCVGSAIVMTIIAILAFVRLVKYQPAASPTLKS